MRKSLDIFKLVESMNSSTPVRDVAGWLLSGMWMFDYEVELIHQMNCWLRSDNPHLAEVALLMDEIILNVDNSEKVFPELIMRFPHLELLAFKARQDLFQNEKYDNRSSITEPNFDDLRNNGLLDKYDAYVIELYNAHLGANGKIQYFSDHSLGLCLDGLEYQLAGNENNLTVAVEFATYKGFELLVANPRHSPK